MNRLVLLVLSVSAMAFSTSACQFGSEAIQVVYDRFQLFRKTKAFDPDDAKIPLELYTYYNDDGVNRLAVRINGVYMVEYYKSDGQNGIQTISGQYHVPGTVILNYKRGVSGTFSFDDWLNKKKFESSLLSIDAELPNDFEENYRHVMVDLNVMRRKMFDFQKTLSQEDIDRVKLYDFHRFPKGGFYGQFIDNDGGNIDVSKADGSDAISGEISCTFGNTKYNQKYNIVDGKVVTDGEPFIPVIYD